MIVHYQPETAIRLKGQDEFHIFLFSIEKRYFLTAVIQAMVFTPLCHNFKFDVKPR